jgi:photosystem II stability/assembly factor-like uncharacterized protein
MKRINILAGLLMLIGLTCQAQNWVQVTSGTTKKLNSIDFPSATIGYIGGNDSILLKTIDGGQTWNEINYSGVTFTSGAEHIINLDFVTENIGFMTVGPYFGSFKTINGGTTWTAITGLNTCYNQGMYFFDESNGFIGGAGCFQGELIDQLNVGVWSPSTVTTSTWDAGNSVVDIDFLDANNGLAASRSGYILRTTDGGQNWDTIPSSIEMNPLTSVLFVNATLAYAGYVSLTAGFGLYTSTDGGLTWGFDSGSATFYYPDFYTLHQAGNGKIYTGGISVSSGGGVIFENLGQFSEWEYAGVAQAVYDISSHSDSIVFAIGDSGQILVNQDLSILSILANEINSIDFQLFPNPVSNELNFINTEELMIENAQIKIFSMTGELVHSEKFTTQINLEKLKSGIYLVKIESENGTTTRKLIKE